ncbi:MAG TPA: PEP-CTERM sorting domain-containing protein [Tepidisphaeraceae bacterium]|jgi:hypothetical protein
MISLRDRLTFAAALMLVLPAGAYAHGPQIQAGVENGRIVTHELFLDEPYQDPTAAQRVFEIPLGQRSLGDANDGWYAEPNHDDAPFTGPGIALLDGQFAAGSNLRVSYLDGLKIWNGSGFVDPGAAQVEASTSALFTPSTVTTDSGPFGSVALAAVTAMPDEHKTIRWRLLGDGVSPNTPSDDGVYLLALQLSTDQAGVSPSEPYYFLLDKDASASDQSAALAAVQSLVPEPSVLGIIAVGGWFLRRGRRRTDRDI